MQELRGTVVILRRLSHEHIAAYRAAFSPIIQQTVHATIDGELAFLQMHMVTTFNNFCYGIFNDAGIFLGAIILHRHGTEYLLYGWIEEQFWGKQLYQDAVRTVAAYFFTQNLSPVLYAYVDCTNKRGYYALKKCGFADIALHNGPYGKQYVLLLRNRLTTEPFYSHIPCLSIVR
jgi:RimJ/RimL family protein N-acetyltransferase